MNQRERIQSVFENKKAFIPFVTAGDPKLSVTEELVCAMAEAGADMIELGIPFSDPVAEGPVIQEADLRALAAGTTTDRIFESVRRIREKTDIPLAFMTYINPVFAYGVDKFIKNAVDCGIDALIVPDMPFEERQELLPACREHGLVLIYLVAPTSKERIQAIARESEGFIYCVSSLGVTGVRSQITTDIKAMVEMVKAVRPVPCAVGFGISTPEQAREMAEAADGVIVGSAIVRLVAEYGEECVEPVRGYMRRMKEAVGGGNLRN